MFKDFIDKFREVVKQQKIENGKWGWDDEKESYSDAGSAKAGGDSSNLQWMSYTVRDNDNDRERRIDVGYDNDGRISGVREFSGKDPDTGYYGATGYYGKQAIADFFKDNFDMDATNYTVSSAPVDIYDPNDVPQEYHNQATVFFDSQADGPFIPSRIFSLNGNLGARWFGDRKKSPNMPMNDREVYNFSDEYRKEKLREGTINNTVYATEIDPNSVRGRA